jgi:archaemetzincin
LSSGEGAPPLSLLDRLSAVTARTLRVSCHVETDGLVVDPHFDEFRNQVWSTAILAQLQDRQPRKDIVLLGVTALDLYVPILTFVFGEAQLSGPCAVISTHRLSDEYYGMPRNEDALLGRLVKEMLHELGHTQGLRHCADWRCVMSSAHTVERIDVRAAAYCRDCAGAFR